MHATMAGIQAPWQASTILAFFVTKHCRSGKCRWTEIVLRPWQGMSSVASPSFAGRKLRVALDPRSTGKHRKIVHESSETTRPLAT